MNLYQMLAAVLSFSVLSCRYGIVLCQMVFISTDIFATIFLGYAMTLARPAK